MYKVISQKVISRFTLYLDFSFLFFYYSIIKLYYKVADNQERIPVSRLKEKKKQPITLYQKYYFFGGGIITDRSDE